MSDTEKVEISKLDRWNLIAVGLAQAVAYAEPFDRFNEAETVDSAFDHLFYDLLLSMYEYALASRDANE
jgi:hypothetical protein